MTRKELEKKLAAALDDVIAGHIHLNYKGVEVKPIDESELSAMVRHICKRLGLNNEDSVIYHTMVTKDAGGYPFVPAMELYDYDNEKPLIEPGTHVDIIIRKDQ